MSDYDPYEDYFDRAEIGARAAAAPVPAAPTEAPPVEPDAEGWPTVTAPGGQS